MLPPDTSSYVHNYSTLSFVKDTLKLIRHYKWRFIVASFFRIVADLLNLYPIYALATTINFLTNYTTNQTLQPLVITMGLWLAASILRPTFLFFSKYHGYRVAEQVSLDAQMNTVNHMTLLDISWHEKENSGNKLKRIQSAGNGLDKVIRIWYNNLIEIGINFIGTIFIVSQFNIPVTILIALFIISYFTISYFMVKPAVVLAREALIKEERVHGLLFELLNNIRTVKVMFIGDALLGITKKDVASLMSTIKERIFRFQIRGSFLHGWGHAFRFVGIVIAVIAIIQGRYEVGFLALFIGYFDRVWESVRELSDISQDIVIARQSVSRMQDILKEPVMIDNEAGKQKFPKAWQKISLNNVSFSYGNNTVLSGLTFDIHRGEKIGIIGLSGAGKSTLFKLLLKEYESYKGDISIDGVSLKDISKRDYFNYVSVVFQETEVFNFSLKDNILFVNQKQKSDKNLLKKAMTVAHVNEFLKKLPEGMDTLIGEKGIKLSGGEKQRLGIARAIFKQPDILLLDEATSHLDLESEEKIQDSLHKFFEQVTAVVIAHRLTTIKEMDKILVVEHGKIVESGSFSELYALGGRFHTLWEKQRF
ncbi:MAG: ABC transporter ATP-binding protein [Candidatus Doudnabacteria bacterium]|nr:ABC transporter ATP-binding protein [Candidatus Doudnabacteria bacterium]